MPNKTSQKQFISQETENSLVEETIEDELDQDFGNEMDYSTPWEKYALEKRLKAARDEIDDEIEINTNKLIYCPKDSDNILYVKDKGFGDEEEDPSYDGYDYDKHHYDDERY